MNDDVTINRFIDDRLIGSAFVHGIIGSCFAAVAAAASNPRMLQ
jgi:hypothetical protein